MKRNPFLTLGALSLLCLTSCGDDGKTKLYGEKITRSDATSILSSIVVTTSATGYKLPTAFSAKVTTLTFALIFVGARTDDIVYDKDRSFYSDVCGGTTLWVYYKDSAMYQLSSVTTTDENSQSVVKKTYTTTSSGFDDAIYNSRTDIFIPTPRSIPQEVLVDKPAEISKNLKAIEADGKYTSGTLSYTIKDEEYRSKGDGSLYLSYTRVPSDGSSTMPCHYIFENSKLVEYYENNGIFAPGGTYSWDTPTYEYPNLSDFTKR